MKIPAVFSVLPNAHSPARSLRRLNLSPAPHFINSAMNTLTIESLKQRSHVTNSHCLIESKDLNVGLSIVLHRSGPEDNGVSQRQMEETERKKGKKSGGGLNVY